MEEKLSKQSINRLDVSDEIINKLENNKIDTLGQLCKKTKSELKKLYIGQNDAIEINKKLQLIGLRLKDSL